MAFFIVSPVARRDVEQLPAVSGLTISRFESACTLFNLVIRLNEVKQMAFFHCLTCRSSRCWTATRCLHIHHFLFWHWGARPSFQVWWLFLLWSLVRFKCAPNSQGDPSREFWLELGGPRALSRLLQSLVDASHLFELLTSFPSWHFWFCHVSVLVAAPTCAAHQFSLVAILLLATAVPPCHMNTPCRAVRSQRGTLGWLWFSVGDFKWLSCTQHQFSLLAYLFSILQAPHACHPFRLTF